MQTIGSQGRLLRIGSYSTAGSFTWDLQPDVGMIVVEVVGGGGCGAGANNGVSGSPSSFGSHCSASGGAGGSSSGSGGLGGSGSGGDINITGNFGESDAAGSSGGTVYFGNEGRGGGGTSTGGGAGAGGYSKKLIKRSSLNSTETVTVGAGGPTAIGRGSAGNSGIVVIYEYSL